jgi:cobalt-zinc-cadmium resistance protein CzcA
LWFVPQQSRAKAFGLNQEAVTKKYEFTQVQLEGNLQQAQLELAKNSNSLKYYEEQANRNADLILQQARKSFEAGEVSYLEFLQAANQARTIKFNYLEKLNFYNQAVIQLDYLSGNFNN